MYHEYLHHKSYLACETTADIHQHNQECSQMFALLYDSAPGGAIGKVTYQDPYSRKHATNLYRLVKPDGYDDLIQSFDIKNGMDFVIQNGKIGIAIYGQNYSYDGNTYMNEALIQLHFLDQNKSDFEGILEQLDYMDTLHEQQIFLEKLYEGDLFLNSAEVIHKLRNQNHRPFEEQIHAIASNPEHTSKSAIARETHHEERIK